MRGASSCNSKGFAKEYRKIAAIRVHNNTMSYESLNILRRYTERKGAPLLFKRFKKRLE